MPLEALRAFTPGSAYASFEDAREGSLGVGKLATARSGQPTPRPWIRPRSLGLRSTARPWVDGWFMIGSGWEGDSGRFA